MSFPSVSLSLPVLALSSLHLFVLLAVSLCCSSSLLHQIEADSCHQTYFRHWHTHNLAHLSLFTLCLSPFPVIPPSCCWTPSEYLLDRVCVCVRACVSICLCVCLTWIGFWAWPLQHRIWRKTKTKRESFLCFFLSLPVHLATLVMGECSLSLFPSLRVGFFEHILYLLFISHKVSGTIVPSRYSVLLLLTPCQSWPASICLLPFVL